MSDSYFVPILYTYRYMWKIKSSESINFKIVTDTEDGLMLFEEALLKLDGIVSCAKEYLHEYDCSKLGVFEKIFELEEK